MSPDPPDPEVPLRAPGLGLAGRLASALDLKVLVEVASRPSDALEDAGELFGDIVRVAPGNDLPDEAALRDALWWLAAREAGEDPLRLIEDLGRVRPLGSRSALVVEDITPYSTGAGADLMDLLAALKRLSPSHRLLFRGRSLYYFPEVADAAVRDATGRRSIDWTDTRYRSEEISAAEAKVHAKDKVIEELSKELDQTSRDRADKEEFISRLSGELPLMQTLIFVDAKLRRYVGAALWPVRLVMRLLLKVLRAVFAIRLNHEAQYPPRPLPAAEEYQPASPPANPPLISIVTPSFNQAGFLPYTIASVLGQGYPRLEYVVQDGGSHDGTVEVLEEIASSLTYWESRPDGGQANAVNLGMRRVGGDILAWLNSDDLLLPGALAYVARYFDEHPEVDVVYGQRILIDRFGHDIGRWVLPPHDPEVVRWADYVPQETLFWRRRIWEAAGGCLDEDFHFALDWDLLLRFAGAGARMARLPRFVGAFRIHDLQKNLTIGHVHSREVRKLITRTHGRDMPAREIHRHMKPFFRRHVLCDRLFRLGLLRYGIRTRFRRRGFGTGI